MTIDKQRVRDVLRDNTSFVHVYIIDVVNNVDATALARIGGLHNPDVLLRLVLLQLLIVIVEVTELVRQDVRIRAEVKCLLAIALLQADNVKAETILASDLVRLREMIELLVLIKALILVTFARARAPQDVPLMTICRAKSVLLKNATRQLVVEPDHLVQKFRVFDVVRLLVAVVWQ